MKRRRTALDVAHEIADGLSARGLHGRFTVGLLGAHDDSEAHYATWHEYRAELSPRFSLTVDQIDKLVSPFRVLRDLYQHRASLRVRFTVQNEEGEAVEGEWRSITRTRTVGAVFGQVASKTRKLAVPGTQSSNYLDVNGVSVILEPEAASD
jgi:hypothetical protein